MIKSVLRTSSRFAVSAPARLSSRMIYWDYDARRPAMNKTSFIEMKPRMAQTLCDSVHARKKRRDLPESTLVTLDFGIEDRTEKGQGAFQIWVYPFCCPEHHANALRKQ